MKNSTFNKIINKNTDMIKNYYIHYGNDYIHMS